MKTSALYTVRVALVVLAACGDSDGNDGASAAGTGGADEGGGAGTPAAGSGGSRSGSGGMGGRSTGGGSGAAGMGSGGRSGAAGMDSGGRSGAAGMGSGGMSGGGGSAAGGSNAPLSFEDAQTLIEEYAAAHPGQDGDINAKTPAQIAADPDAQQLLALCGEGQRPVIPQLVWEYGGSDHAWINYEASALVYCVYIPASPSTDHWQYDAAMDHVTADVYVLYPDDNPCKDMQGADQVTGCIGDMSNFEILVDTASLNDGVDVGLELSEASTDLMLVLPDGTKVHLFFGA